MLDDEYGPDTPISYINKYRKPNTSPSISEYYVNTNGRDENTEYVKPGLERLQDILPYPINYPHMAGWHKSNYMERLEPQ